MCGLHDPPENWTAYHNLSVKLLQTVAPPPLLLLLLFLLRLRPRLLQQQFGFPSPCMNVHFPGKKEIKKSFGKFVKRAGQML